MESSESSQPPPNESDEAIIRNIMDVEGVSFEEARREWEMEKARVAAEKFEKEHQEDE